MSRRRTKQTQLKVKDILSIRTSKLDRPFSNHAPCKERKHRTVKISNTGPARKLRSHMGRETIARKFGSISFGSTRLQERSGRAARRQRMAKLARTIAAGLIEDWSVFLNDTPPTRQTDAMRRCTRTGRPLGSTAFIRRLEDTVGRRLRPNKRGPAGPTATNER